MTPPTSGPPPPMAAASLRCEEVFAVIVTYNPDLTVLQQLLDALLPQVGQAMVVDNGSTADVVAWCERRGDSRLTVRGLGRNEGIAEAQNVGVGAARQAAAGYVLLSDQDSKPAPDMVAALRDVLVQLARDGVNAAAAGPCYLDARQDNPSPFIRVEGLRRVRCCEKDYGAVVKVDHLIASGCLIPMAALNAVGLMRRDMFIDYVDIEWGLRAKSLGWQSWGVFAARMSHSLGDTPGKFMGVCYSIGSPLRHYYKMRNAVWLCQQAHVPRNWKWVEGYMIVLRFVLYAALAKPRWAHVSKMVRGLVHGLKSRLGPYG